VEAREREVGEDSGLMESVGGGRHQEVRRRSRWRQEWRQKLLLGVF